MSRLFLLCRENGMGGLLNKRCPATPAARPDAACTSQRPTAVLLAPHEDVRTTVGRGSLAQPLFGHLSHLGGVVRRTSFVFGVDRADCTQVTTQKTRQKMCLWLVVFYRSGSRFGGGENRHSNPFPFFDQGGRVSVGEGLYFVMFCTVGLFFGSSVLFSTSSCGVCDFCLNSQAGRQGVVRCRPMSEQRWGPRPTVVRTSFVCL